MNPMPITNCFHMLRRMNIFMKTRDFSNMNSVLDMKVHWEKWGLIAFDPKRPITRNELCVMLDKCILLFGSKNLPMDINGKISFVYSQF